MFVLRIRTVRSGVDLFDCTENSNTQHTDQRTDKRSEPDLNLKTGTDRQSARTRAVLSDLVLVLTVGGRAFQVFYHSAFYQLE
jgi:hypothetical protein